MAKFKFDAQKAKQFAVEKVEIVAMAACTFLTFIFLITCVLAVFGSSSEDAKITANAKAVKTAIDTADPDSGAAPEKGADGADGKKDAPKDGDKKPPDTSWAEVSPARFLTRTPLYDAALAGYTKRRNPLILPIDVTDKTGKEKYLQIDVVVGGVKKYLFNTREQKVSVVVRPEDKGAQTALPPVQELHTERMAIVTATFPYKEQVALFRKALRIEKTEDLFGKGLAPMLAGLNVYRLSFDPATNKTVGWRPVYVRYKDGEEEKVLGGPATYTRNYVSVRYTVKYKDRRDGADKEEQQEQKFAVIAQDKDGKLVVSLPVQQLLMEGVYDNRSVSQFGRFICPTAWTPLPALADRPWPKLALDDKAGIVPPDDGTPVVEDPPVKGSENPGGILTKIPAKGAKPGVLPPEPMELLTSKEWPAKKLGKFYEDRLKGNVNPFNPFGIFPDADKEGEKEPGKEDEKAKGKPQMYMPPSYNPDQMKRMMGMMGSGKRPDMPKSPANVGGGTETSGQPTMAGIGGLSESGKTLVRFFDAGLEPGKMYQYSIQVRMLNPNYGKTKEVAYPDLAVPRELPSEPVLTPPVSVPKELDFYVVDQSPLETSLKGERTVKRGLVPPGKAAVQIHQWVEVAGPKGFKKPVADWVIAERLFVERGETIARNGLEVEVPTWDKLGGVFHFGVGVMQPAVGVGGRKFMREVRKTAVPINFGDEENGPLVVDFEGGKTQYKVPAGTIQDDGNLNMLVLTPDGKLLVRSSRADADEETPTGGERLRHYDAWRARLQAYRNPGQAAASGKQ